MEDQEGEDEEEEGPVDESLELFLREAWREEMVEFIRTGLRRDFSSWNCSVPGERVSGET